MSRPRDGWQTEPATQIRWCLDYIRNRYSDTAEDKACPRCGRVNWGQTPAGQPECASCGYVDA